MPNTKESSPIQDDEILAVDVISAADGWRVRHPGAAIACTRAARAAFGVCDGPPAAVCVLLTDDVQMRDFNVRFRRIDRPTNVLSFVADEGARNTVVGARHLGDLAIGLETMEREAAAEGKPVLDHLQHLIVHGMLHLLGYDHETGAEAEMMERTEVEILAALGVGDPYRDGDDDRI